MIVPVVAKLLGVAPSLTGHALVGKKVVVTWFVEHLQIDHELYYIVWQGEDGIMAVLSLVTMEKERLL